MHNPEKGAVCLINLFIFDVIHFSEVEKKMRKTKIVCTLGPSTDSEEIIAGLCHAGMNVARLNFSHGIHEEHQKRIDTVKKSAVSFRCPLP